MKLTSLTIKNYRGVTALETRIGPNGALIVGACATNKTSCLRAIKAALEGADIGADAIHLGEDRAEILIDMDAIKVKRVITQKNSTLTVKNAEGFSAPSPQTFLRDLLGSSLLDPLSLYLAKDDKRRKIILDALPITVTADKLRQWVPDLPAAYDCTGHGLEVVGRLRAEKYALRTTANAAAKAAREQADRIAAEAKAMAEKVPAGALAVSVAMVALGEAAGICRDLDAEAQAAAKSIERTAKARARITELKAAAATARPGSRGPSPTDVKEQENGVAHAAELVKEAEEALRVAQTSLNEETAALIAMHAAVSSFNAAEARALQLDQQADELAATLAETAITAPTEEALAEAGLRKEVAQAALLVANQADAADKRALEAGALKDAAKAAEVAASSLDAVVRALTNEAPAMLLAESKGIPGLSIDGDSIALDGVHLDTLSGGEQLRFAVDVAKRANAKSKILICDGLERLDPKRLDQFVKFATADDWQLLATRVTAGELMFVAIEPEEAKAAE